MRRLSTLLLTLALTAPVPAAAQPVLELAPGTKYDAKIPTLKAVLGHEPGERITTPEGITQYLKALSAAAPERTRLVEYARTWEGRPLHVLIVASAERIAGLDAVKRDLRRLADPRTLAAGEAETLIARLPVVTWLIHAVHGNEISSSDAALAEAYHLLAAQGDPAVDADPARVGRADRPAGEPRRPRALRRSRTCRARPRSPMPSPPPPSTTSRGRAAGRTTTSST